MSEESERRILKQDQPQFEQSQRVGGTAKRREAEAAQAEYELQVSQYNQEQKEAEEKYQRELAEYEKSQETQRKKDAIEKKYDSMLQELESNKSKAIVAARSSIEGNDANAREARAAAQAKVEQQYKTKIAGVTREKNSVLLPILLKEQGYPQYAIDKATRAYSSGKALTVGSAIDRAETLVKGKEAQAERGRVLSAKVAQDEAARLSTAYHSQIIGKITGFGLSEGSERAGAIKSTPDVITGKQAIGGRRPLTGVDTGQSIMGRQSGSSPIKITSTETYRKDPTKPASLDNPVLVKTVTREIPEKPTSKGVSPKTNPVALLAGMFKQEVTPAGTKPEDKTIFSFQNVENVKEESGRALLEFQSQLKTQTAPSAGVYKEILRERGLPLTPLSKRIIETFSEKPTKEYKTIAEVYGLEEPKGRKGIVSKIDGTKLFDLETGEGSIRIGRLLGFKYGKPQLVSELGEGVQGPVQPSYNILDAFGNPRTDKSGNIILLKSEKATERLSKTEKPSSLIIPTMKGPVELKVVPPKKTEFNRMVESSFKTVDQSQSFLQKNYPVIAGITNPVLELGKIGVGAFGSIVNIKEQYVEPFVREKTGLIHSKPQPITFEGKTSDEVLLPIDIGRSFESKNLVFKEKYFEGIYEYGKKYGVESLVTGGATYYAGKGILQVPKRGLELVKSAPKLLKVIAKPALPRIGKAAREAALLGSTGKITTPSRMWDVAEPVQKVGLRIERKPQPIGIVKKTELPVPYPFGKERIIPYYLRQGVIKASDYLQTTGSKIGKRVAFTTPVFLKNFGDISLNPAHLGTKPNIPTRQEISPPIEYKRTYPDLQRMRGIFYPEIPASRPKASVIPPGFVKVRPKLVTAKSTAKKIIGLPKTIKNKIQIPKITTPQFIKKSQRDWQAFTFMQKKRIGEFRETLPTLPKLPAPKANQFVTFQRKARDIKSGILETKRLGLQLFEWPVAKKQIVPAFGKQELKNLTREDIGIPSNIKIITKKEQSNFLLESKIDEFNDVVKKLNESRDMITWEGIKGRTPLDRDIAISSLSQRKSQLQTEIKQLQINESLGIKSKPLSLGIAPTKSPPFMEGFIEKPFKARRGKAPIEISFRSDISGLGRVSQIPESFYNVRRRFPKSPIEFDITPKGTGMDALKGPTKEWSKNWMLKQRKVSAQDYLYKLEKVKGKREWVEYPIEIKIKESPFRSALPSKATRITSERYRQMPKMDLSWPKLSKPKISDPNWRDMADVRREMKGETNMLFSDPRRTSKVNVRLIKSEMVGISDYFKTATPFQLKQPGLKEWPTNWKDLAKSEKLDVADYLSQKRSMRQFGKTEKEKMLKGVGGAGASSYGPVGFKRFGKQIPTSLFILEKGRPPIQFPTKQRRGPNLDISKEDQARLDKVWGQGMARVLQERKKGELPQITTRAQDTAQTVRGKAKLSFVSEPMRTTPIVMQRGIGIFDKPISIRKGKLVRGLKPVRGVWDYLPDKFKETRVPPKGGKPMMYSGWQPRQLVLPKQKDTGLVFKREITNKYQIFNKDTAVGSITPAKIIEWKKFTSTPIKLGKGKTDVFFRKFEKSPINSPMRKERRKGSNLDISKKEQDRLDKVWEETEKRTEGETRKGKGGQQILVPPEPRNPLKLPEPEDSIPESFAATGAKQPTKKEKKGWPLIIPPRPKETQQEQIQDEIILSQYRPKLDTIPRMTIKVSHPQRIETGFKLSTVQPQRLSILQRTQTKQKQPTKQREQERYVVLQTPRIRQAQKITPKLASPLAPKAPTRLSTPVMPKIKQPNIQVLRYRTPEEPRPPKRALAALLPKENKIPKSVLQKQKEKADFLGASSEISISGIFGKRSEITYGQKKIAKLLKGDVRVVQGKPRSTRRGPVKWKEGKQGDMFGFKNEAKKRAKGKTRFW